MSRFDSVLNAMTGLGDPSRDKGSAGAVDLFRRRLTLDELTALFEHGGIANRIVTLLPREACRKGWTVPEVDDLEQALHIHAQVRDAMTWARLYGGSIAVLVTEDDVPPAFRTSPAKWLEQPLDLRRVGRFAAVQVFDAFEARPGPIDEDLTSPAYRTPSWWDISTQGQLLRIHNSRVLHFRGAPLPPHKRRRPNPMPDASELQRIWDEVYRLSATMQGGAVLAQEIRESVLRVGGLENVATSDQEEQLTARISLMSRAKSLLGMVVLGQGDEYTNRSNPPTGFSELSGEARTMLAGVVGWPQTVLYGEAPGGLSTDGDSGWQLMNRITAAYQEDHRDLLDRIYTLAFASQEGPTGGTLPDPSERTLTFLPLDEPDQKEQAETREVIARADVAYVNLGVISPEEVRRNRFGEEGWQVDIRELDEPDEPDESDEALTAEGLPNAADVQATALNGAQVSSALTIIGMVATRQLPRETGIASLQRFFSLSAGEAEAIMGPVGSGFFVEPTQAAPAPAPAPAQPTLDAIHRLDALVASRGACVYVPVAPTTLGADAPLNPHITVLYLGPIEPSDHDELLRVVREEALRVDAGQSLFNGTLARMGAEGEVLAITWEYSYPLHDLNARLLRRLAHMIRARQFPSYRAHLTLGPVDESRLGQAVDVRIPIDELVVSAGDVELGRIRLGV